MSRIESRLLAAVASSLLCAGAAACSSAGQPSDAAGPGCDPRQTAVAHHGGGQLLTPQPAGAPASCAATTGFTAVDATMVVTKSGKLVFGPAAPPNLAISSNEGAAWSPIALPSGPSSKDMLLHPWLWQDPQSARIFYNIFDTTHYACPDGSGSRLWISDDEGTTWAEAAVGCGSQDWGKLTTGPAFTAANKAALTGNGYPNMVYFCAGGPTLIVGPDHFCYRSVDGGKTFARTAGNPVDSNNGQHGYPNSGAIGPDGTFYMAHGSATGLAIAVSQDEGDTWKDTFVTGSTFAGSEQTQETWLSSNLTTDSAGTVYAVWVDDTMLLPFVATSKDHGVTWSTPVMFGAPGVQVAAYPNVTVRAPGAIAIAYYGSAQAMASGNGNGYAMPDGRPYDAYLAVTTNLFADDPVFWTAMVNDPDKPVVKGISFQFSEYLGYPVFNADGSVFASYVAGGKGLTGRLGAAP